MNKEIIQGNLFSFWMQLKEQLTIKVKENVVKRRGSWGAHLNSSLKKPTNNSDTFHMSQKYIWKEKFCNLVSWYKYLLNISKIYIKCFI